MTHVLFFAVQRSKRLTHICASTTAMDGHVATLVQDGTQLVDLVTPVIDNDALVSVDMESAPKKCGSAGVTEEDAARVSGAAGNELCTDAVMQVCNMRFNVS